MSVPLEHDYVSLSKIPSSMEKSSDKFSHQGLNLKATELRLGLPGSVSPDRDSGLEDINGYPLGLLKSLVSGAKRGFSDAIDGVSGKWVLSGKGGSEMGLAKDCGLFSPKGANSGNNNLVGSDSTNHQTGVKDSVPQSSKPLHEKKPQLTAPLSKYYYHIYIDIFLLFHLFYCLIDRCCFCSQFSLSVFSKCWLELGGGKKENFFIDLF